MKHNQIPNLKQISLYRFENFFNVYTEERANSLYYNILRSINVFKADNAEIEDEHIVKYQDTWVSISYQYYNTIDLWWLVCTYNGINNPTKMPELGTTIKLLKPDFVGLVLEELNSQVNR